jgi:hypothetical protein
MKTKENLSLLTYKDGKPVRGLLADLINERASTYVEPSRKGTSRGQAIGFPREKYVAALLYLTNFPLEHQAKALKVSHGLLRKWRTEKKFWDVVGDHLQELSKRFWSVIKDHVEKEKVLWEKFAELPLEQQANFEIPSLPYTEFEDSFLYNPHMSPHNFRTPFAKSSFELSDDELMIFLEGDNVARMVGWMRAKSADDFRAGLKRHFSPTIVALKNLFIKDELTIDERKRGIFLLRWLENDFENSEAEPIGKKEKSRKQILDFLRDQRVRRK